MPAQHDQRGKRGSAQGAKQQRQLGSSIPSLSSSFTTDASDVPVVWPHHWSLLPQSQSWQNHREGDVAALNLQAQCLHRLLGRIASCCMAGSTVVLDVLGFQQGLHRCCFAIHQDAVSFATAAAAAQLAHHVLAAAIFGPSPRRTAATPLERLLC
jgi:hypothetical protein